ncbi:MAG: ATP-binding protein [Bacteroidota bacterium]
MADFTPHIGKNVIEILTLGMYEDPRFIFREYVQNAADQIDTAVEEKILDKKSDGEINIIIDKENRLISIKDNATGIQNENVLNFLGDVANSQKDREKRKGFRGIGRLGGLGYCEKLVFETSYKGEPFKNIITLNAKQLRQIIDNKADVRDAAAVISAITDLNPEDALSEKHYFHVTLHNVTNDRLLNIASVSDYLSMVAPIPFHPDFPMKWKEKIYNYYKANRVAIDEYDVHLNLNENKLFKPYKSVFFKKRKQFSKLLDVVPFHIVSEEGEIIAIGWFGITDKLNHQIPDENIERGIRLRKENIAIGNKFTLSRFFRQSRQNLNYIGEVHAIGSGFTPNARRDYFNDSNFFKDTNTISYFEKKLKHEFSSLGSLTQDSSNLHNRLGDIKKYKDETKKFELERKSGKLTDRQIEHKEEEIKNLKSKAKTSAKQIKKLKDKATKNSSLLVVYQHIIGEEDIEIDASIYETGIPSQAFSFPLSQLSEECKKVVEEIFETIRETLTISEAESLIKKIAERYN